MTQGLLFVITAPSGCGKGSLRRALTAEDRGIVFCPSVTTRSPRPGETDGADYCFITEQEFFSRVERDELVEWACVYGNYYGTPGKTIDAVRSKGSDVIVEKDVQGARTLRRVYPEGIFIFILPPSLEELRRRIEQRGTEEEHEVNLRLAGARQEISDLSAFDYVIINSDLDRAKERLIAIVAGERVRRRLGKDAKLPEGEGRASNGKPTAEGPTARITVQACDCGGQEGKKTGRRTEPGSVSGHEACHHSHGGDLGRKSGDRQQQAG